MASQCECGSEADRECLDCHTSLCADHQCMGCERCKNDCICHLRWWVPEFF